MKLQADAEGERAMAGILLGVALGLLLWVIAIFMFYVWFIA